MGAGVRRGADQRQGFNGAAPVKARKFAASDNGADELEGFNGAAPVKARKFRTNILWRAGYDTLQWGRAG